ncbi:probable rhamnogalacturonate lyase B isoform X4 [Cornus florida]|uniref:probable rhamnogalacturonate lyase B isoform X4 n=1 Tax=Cornus florida TaxID=4283 RepID=UPI00289FC561|nr:probable rhamnogalacturonate lyase B isoform X4 [Cornus florida]
MDNGLVKVTLSNPMGMVTGIEYGGIDNLLEDGHNEKARGYWDVVWSSVSKNDIKWLFYRIEGTNFRVIMEDENQIELSFSRTWNNDSETIPLNIDKRFIMLRGSPGFYSYAIYERHEGWPDLSIMQTRIAFKLQREQFHYMAISDKRQRIMPTDQDRYSGKTLDYKEAVLLTNPKNPDLKGEVDDKYQYSSNNKDNRVHGWISSNPRVGFWVITPSDEFRAGGPLKQELTSHVGPTTLAMFFSAHYAGEPLTLKLRNGEPWKKVYGPVFIYLNSVSNDERHQQNLWEDAKSQMHTEMNNWPYNFPLSEDFPHADQRGTVHGRLLVRDKYKDSKLMPASSAYIGFAPPGDAGSWQEENKGYQFWTQADAKGKFSIKGVRAGKYSLYAWVPGVIGDYLYNVQVTVTPGSEIKLGDLIYYPLRSGPTLWEIGVPDRTAAEFYVPDPASTLMNRLYNNHTDKFRQYGLWDRYTDLYPNNDLIYTVGVSDYKKDWFFAHVNRNLGNKTYVSTTWQIVFDLKNVNPMGTYTLRLALASATMAELQVRLNDPKVARPNFTTGLIGRENAIARHGIHGLYRLYNVDISGSKLSNGRNIIFLTQSRGSGPFMGVMYDYIRFEGPPENY